MDAPLAMPNILSIHHSTAPFKMLKGRLHDKSLKIASTLSLNSRLASRQLHETSLKPDFNWRLASPVVCLSLD